MELNKLKRVRMQGRKNTWLMQLVTIAGKGCDARRMGLPLDDCPYRGQRGLQGQRREAWLEGWYSEDRLMREEGRSGRIA